MVSALPLDLRRIDGHGSETPSLRREGGTYESARPTDRSVNFLPTALTSVDAEIRQRVASRLTFDAHHYALRIDTTIDADRRRWYVVAQIHNGRVNVLHRAPITL